MISARHLNEIYIVDHSTTTAEAAGHIGGDSNMGGDILWRWGNQEVYRQGTIADEQLFLQHDAQWVQDGFVDAGKISVFNNGGDGTGSHSSIHLIQPIINAGVYTIDNGIFLPLDFDWSWTGTILGEQFLEGKKCGVQSLKNGNLIFCENSKGQLTEVTKSGDIVWVYKNPTGSLSYAQYDNVLNGDNGLFRGEKYSPDFIGFTTVDLTPQDIIEDLNLESDTCIQSLDIVESETFSSYIINTIVQEKILFNQTIESVIIYTVEGKMVTQIYALNSDVIHLNLSPGMYILEVKPNTGIVRKEKIIIR